MDAPPAPISGYGCTSLEIQSRHHMRTSSPFHRATYWFCFGMILLSALDRAIVPGSRLIPRLLGTLLPDKSCSGPFAIASSDCAAWALGPASVGWLLPSNYSIIMRLLSAVVAVFLLWLLWSRIRSRSLKPPASLSVPSSLLALACALLFAYQVVVNVFPTIPVLLWPLQLDIHIQSKWPSLAQALTQITRPELWFSGWLFVWFWITHLSFIVPSMRKAANKGGDA